MVRALGCYEVEYPIFVITKHFGKFSGILEPGYHYLPWCLRYRIVGGLSLGCHYGKQLDLKCQATCALQIQQIYADTNHLFKSLLMELTQKRGFCKPEYETTQSGSLHMPTFFSTVKVMGKQFHGKASRSKKQAQHGAAKMAYNALKDCPRDERRPELHYYSDKNLNEASEVHPTENHARGNNFWMYIESSS